MFFRHAVLTLTALLASSSSFAPCQTPQPGAPSPGQRFVCNVGYSPQQCHLQMEALRRSLETYHAERLGEWTWVLVRSDDWRQLTELRHLDPRSPAFTSLERRETLFEEALVVPVPSRRAELMVHWAKNVDDLLTLAVTHELGHALCRETNEYKADRNGERLRAGQEVVCR
jgi:hypothetical protein